MCGCHEAYPGHAVCGCKCHNKPEVENPWSPEWDIAQRVVGEIPDRFKNMEYVNGYQARDALEAYRHYLLSGRVEA